MANEASANIARRMWNRLSEENQSAAAADFGWKTTDGRAPSWITQGPAAAAPQKDIMSQMPKTPPRKLQRSATGSGATRGAAPSSASAAAVGRLRQLYGDHPSSSDPSLASSDCTTIAEERQGWAGKGWEGKSGGKGWEGWSGGWQDGWQGDSQGHWQDGWGEGQEGTDGWKGWGGWQQDGWDGCDDCTWDGWEDDRRGHEGGGGGGWTREEHVRTQRRGFYKKWQCARVNAHKVLPEKLYKLWLKRNPKQMDEDFIER